ncbi:MAG TPA: cytochrome c [Fimbriimonas sp.]|nr:cytochrome c [Fimbriimonas sp.]
MKREALGSRLKGLALLAAGVMLAGCHTDMWVQTKTEPLRESDFFADGMSARPLVPGTIARDHIRMDDGYFTGVENGKWLKDIPIEVNEALLKRGQERFDIYCSPCHGRLGDGQGMIANRGFELRRPVGNYHTERLRKMPAGHFYDVITNGYGTMFSYASRVEPQDRWAIVAYIRALQLSRHATEDQAARAATLAPPPAPTGEHAEGGAE